MNIYNDSTGVASESSEDPAVIKAGFNPTLEKIKYIGKKVLKWAAIGALVGAVALTAVVGMAMLGTASSLPILGAAGLKVFGGVAAGIFGLAATVATAVGVACPWCAVGAMGIATATTGGLGVGAGFGVWSLLSNIANVAAGVLGASTGVGLMAGAAIGLAAGVIAGFSGADDAVDEMRQDIVERHRRELGRLERAEQVAHQLRMQKLLEVKQAMTLGIDTNLGVGTIPQRSGIRQGGLIVA